jgi:hypothetical protein
MKLRSTLWLQVCLSILIAASSAFAADSAAVAAAAADVPASVRTANEADRKMNKPSVQLTDVQILEHAREANDDVYNALQSFVCNEQINRFKGNLTGEVAKPVDVVTAKLSFEKGSEQYTEVHQNNRAKAGMSSIPGAWSEGEFGTLLMQTQQLLQTQSVNFDSFTDVAGEQAANFHFDVTSEESPWDLLVAGHHYKVAFRTNVTISVATGEILKIQRASINLDKETRISGIEWGITLAHVDLSGKPWLLPRTGTYAVSYQESKHKEWNELSFSGYKRYSAETAVKFD